MKYTRFLATIASAWVFSSPSLASLVDQSRSASENGLAIAVAQDKQDTGFGDMYVVAKMILIDESGKESVRDMRVKVLEGADDQGDKTLTTFQTPRDIKGTGLLTYAHLENDNDQWLYMPAIKRVKRIATSSMAGAFLGSEFSFEDLSGFAYQKYDFSYVGKDTLKGKSCYVVESMPKSEDSGYSKMKTWIDTETLVTLKIEFYDKKDSHLKTLVVDDLSLYKEKYWRPHLLTMTNHQTHKVTRFIYEDYQFDNEFNGKDFNKNALKRAR